VRERRKEEGKKRERREKEGLPRQEIFECVRNQHPAHEQDSIT
jgi:hypothetical protein